MTEPSRLRGVVSIGECESMNSKFSIAALGTVVFGLVACVGVPTDVFTGDATDPITELSAPPTSHVLQALHCSVDLTRSTPLQCAPPSGGDEAALIVGGQGSYVTLSSDGWSAVIGDVVVLQNVTIENLMVQKLGTEDGLTAAPSGTQVFFYQPPTNGVTVNNATDTGIFLESNHDYFQYDGIIAPQGGLSVAHDWEFDLNGQTQFEFGVLVASPIPNEDGVLKVVSNSFLENPWLGGTWNDMWVLSEDRAIVVGPNMEFSIYDGGFEWSDPTPITPSTSTLTGVWAADADNIWAVGTDGYVWLGDGTTWEPKTAGLDPADLDVNAVWGTPAGDFVYIVALTSEMIGQMYVAERTGDSWSNWSIIGVPINFMEMHTMHGTSSTNIWVGASFFGESVVRRWNGISWQEIELDGGAYSIADIWAVSDQEVWFVGTNAIFRTTDGGATWTDMRGPGQPFEGVPDGNFTTVWAPRSNYVWIGRESDGVDGNTLLHCDGGTA